MDDVEKLAREALAEACVLPDGTRLMEVAGPILVDRPLANMAAQMMVGYALSAITTAILAERERCAGVIREQMGITPFPDYIELEVNGALETALARVIAPPTP